MSKKILLVFAGRKVNVPRLPMSCLVLAAYVREHGYSADILDLRLDNKFEKIDFNQYLCVGISAEAGILLTSGIAIAKHIKKNYSKIPIIWGSYLVSFFPQEALSNNYIDCIVKGEGEKALINVLKDIEKGDIKGCYKKVYEEQFLNMEELPFPAYDLVDIKRYSDITEGISYETSRGCPNKCKFCYVNSFHKSRWRAKSAEKVLNDIELLIKNTNIKKIKIFEDNFFVDKQRVIKIAKGFIKRKFNLSWSGTVRLDYLSRYSLEELRILKESGFWLASVGAESGNQRILDFIKKDITLEQTRRAVKNCINAKIMPQISLMIGFPTETKEEVLKTLDFYDKLIAMDKNLVEINGIFLFSPCPGTELYDEVVKKYNYNPPKNFVGWSKWRFNNLNNITWFKKDYRKYLQNISTISRFKFFTHRINFVNEGYVTKKLKLNILTRPLFNIFVKFYKISADIRWRKRAFSFAPEWWIYERLRNITTELI